MKNLSRLIEYLNLNKILKKDNRSYNALLKNMPDICPKQEACAEKMICPKQTVCMNKIMNSDVSEKLDIICKLNPVPTFITTLDEGKIVRINYAFSQLYGYSELEIIGKSILSINFYENPKDRDYITKELKEQGFCENRELKLKKRDGKLIIGLFSAHVFTINGVRYIISVYLDITRRKLMEAELKKQEKQYRCLFNNAAEMICVIQDLKIKLFNSYFEELTGYTQEDLDLLNYLELIVPEDREYVKNKHEERLENELLKHRYQFRMIKKDTTEMWVEINTVTIDWEDRTAVLCFLTDITERMNKEKEVLYLSYHDQLTGLYNRRFYEEDQHILDNSKNLPLTIVMADVNGLKLTNDAFGHLAGDKLLKETAKILKQNCKAKDIAARIGGDEFVILLPNTDFNDAASIVERMKKNLNNKKVDSMYLSVSFGFYTKYLEEEDIDIIITRAEDDMYRNKLMESELMRTKTVKMILENFFQNNQWEDRHSKAVSELSASLAKEMGFNKEEIEAIRIAGLLHDIGKTALRKDMLMKAETLSDAERLEIKRHPEIGSHILKSTSQYAKIAEYVIAHHERIDGNGYPKGLKGNKIPIQARIIAIANAFDAMVNDSPYHKALSKNDAVMELLDNSGTQFDSELTNVFIQKVIM